jgi:methylmalonyl-CoA mutase
MTSATDDLRLAADFAPATYDDWRKLVDGVLKGAPFEKLVGKTYDGLKIDPIYPRARDAAPIAGRAPAAPWQIMQRIDHPDAGAANAQALHDLENGANGLTLIFSSANGAYGFGLEPSAAAIEKVLDGIFIDAGISIELQIGPQSRMAAIHVAEYIKRKGLSPAACDIRFGLDPIGACAVWGSSPYAWAEIAPTVTGGIKGLAALGFKGPFTPADGRVIHDAGGSEVQELAFVLATGVAYLRAMDCVGGRTGHGLCAAFRRRRPVPDHGKIPRAAAVVGTDRSRQWACVETVVHCRRHRVADADPARPLCEHAARDDGDLFGRPRRRRQHQCAAAYAGAGIA